MNSALALRRQLFKSDSMVEGSCCLLPSYHTQFYRKKSRCNIFAFENMIHHLFLGTFPWGITRHTSAVSNKTKIAVDRLWDNSLFARSRQTSCPHNCKQYAVAWGATPLHTPQWIFRGPVRSGIPPSTPFRICPGYAIIAPESLYIDQSSPRINLRFVITGQATLPLERDMRYIWH